MKIKIAVADDQPIVRAGLVTLLKTEPEFEVTHEAYNGAELIRQLSNTNILPDVCILDIRMPEMDGYQTTAAIRARWKNIKVIALTMCDSEVSILKMIQNGANGYLFKDATYQELSTAIRKVSVEGCFYSKEVFDSMAVTMERTNGDITRFISPNEFSFLKLCCSDLTYKAIAGCMNLSLRTIEGYRDSLFRKLNITSRLGLMLYGVSSGFQPFSSTTLMQNASC